MRTVDKVPLTTIGVGDLVKSMVSGVPGEIIRIDYDDRFDCSLLIEWDNSSGRSSLNNNVSLIWHDWCDKILYLGEEL